MKARLAKKICKTPYDKLSPWWFKAIFRNDEKINKAIRKCNRNKHHLS